MAMSVFFAISNTNSDKGTGNLMVFKVIVVNRTMHTSTNVLLLNFAFSDILFVTLNVPVYLASEICNRRWVLGKAMAKFSRTSVLFCFASAVFTMIAIALERYLAVVQPLKHMARRKKTTVAKAISIIWICSIALSLPQVIFTDIKSYSVYVKRNGVMGTEVINFIVSKLSRNDAKIYDTAIFIFTAIIPIVVLSYFYPRIVCRLWNPDRQLNQEPARVATTHDQPQNFVTTARRRTTVMLIVVLVVYLVTTCPYNMFSMILMYLEPKTLDVDTLLQIDSIVKVFLMINSASNPIIYYFMSEKFRVGYRSIFSCCCRLATRVVSS